MNEKSIDGKTVHIINDEYYCDAKQCVIPGYCDDRVLTTRKIKGLPYACCNIGVCEHRKKRN